MVFLEVHSFHCLLFGFSLELIFDFEFVFHIKFLNMAGHLWHVLMDEVSYLFLIFIFLLFLNIIASLILADMPVILRKVVEVNLAEVVAAEQAFNVSIVVVCSPFVVVQAKRYAN